MIKRWNLFSRKMNSRPLKIPKINISPITPTKISSLAAGTFKLNENDTYDFIYDRASLVAMPSPMRKSYAQVIKQSLKQGGKYLLIVYEYDQSKLDGPPFSVDANEIHELYEDQFTIKLMESKQPTKEGPRFSSLNSLKQKVYILEKTQ